MPSAEARIRTDRASRYLTQLCAHLTQISDVDLDPDPEQYHGHRHREGAAMLRPRRTECADTNGLIEFDRARCTLHASADELVLFAEADDEQRLRLVREAITARLQTIGHREQLSLTWEPGPSQSGQGVRDAAALVQQMMTPGGRADPSPLYAAAHKLGPVSALPDGSLLICGYAAVNQVLREPRFGVPEPVAPDAGNDALQLMNQSVLRANPPDHGRMRSLISKVFTPRRVADLQPTIEAAVDDLLDRLGEAAADGPVDFMDLVAFPLPVTVIGELLGVPPSDRRRFRPLAADLTEALELSGSTSATANTAARELAGYFTHLISERRTAPGDDLISALVAARDAEDGRLSDQELLANLILLLVAGFETTTDLLGNGLTILLDRPDLAGALRTGQIPIAGFIEEVLRYDSPVQVATRQARTDGLTVEGIPIPEGRNAILLIGAANRDPARYRDPDRFDPTRTDTRPLSFGAGPHICIGNNLARLEASVAFSKLLTRFPQLSAPPGRPPLRRDRLVLRGFQTLPLSITSPGDRR
jgi:cytochrome P450